MKSYDNQTYIIVHISLVEISLIGFIIVLTPPFEFYRYRKWYI